MINTKQVDITPARRESQMIRPSSNLMSGKSPNTSTQWASPNVISPDSGVYNRVNKVKQDRLDRSRELEDAERIRGQVLEDNAVKRNQQIEDLDRKRIETISDTELDYERGREGREFTRRKNKEYFKTLERDRAKQNKDNKQLKDKMLINAKIAYAKVLDQEKQGATDDELREGLEQQRQDLAKQRESNKKTFIVNVMSSVGMTMEGDDDESIDKINSIVASEFPGKVWEDLVTYEHKFRVANKLASMAGDGAIRVSGIEDMINNQSAQTAEIQKSLNESIESYDSMLLEIRSKSISSNSVSGLKDMYKNRIIELGGNIDQFMAEGEDENGDEPKEKPEEPSSSDPFYDNFASKDEQGKMDISQARQNVEDIEKDRSSITGSVTQSISDGASNLNEGIKNAGGYGKVAKEGLVTMAENPGATIAGGYLAKEGVEGAIKGGKSMVASNNSAKKAEKILEMIEADDFFKNYDKDFLSKNGVKPYPKPKPTVTGMGGAGVKEYVEWKQGFDKHIDAEVASKTKTFIGRTRKLLDKARGNKLLKTLGLIGVGAEVISIGKDAFQALGFYVPDELKAAQHELYKLQQFQKSNEEKSKALGEMLIEASEDDNSTEVDSNATQVDVNSGANLIKPEVNATAPMVESNATAPMPEANATAPMVEANATAPSASVIKPEQPIAPTSMPSRDNASDQPQPDIVTSQMSTMLGQQFDSNKIRINDFKSNGRDYGFGYFDESGSSYYTGMVSPDGKIISLKRIPIDEYGRPSSEHEKLL